MDLDTSMCAGGTCANSVPSDAKADVLAWVFAANIPTRCEVLKVTF